jgi:hypothetical protein
MFRCATIEALGVSALIWLNCRDRQPAGAVDLDQGSQISNWPNVAAERNAVRQPR